MAPHYPDSSVWPFINWPQITFHHLSLTEPRHPINQDKHSLHPKRNYRRDLLTELDWHSKGRKEMRKVDGMSRKLVASKWQTPPSSRHRFKWVMFHKYLLKRTEINSKMVDNGYKSISAYVTFMEKDNNKCTTLHIVCTLNNLHGNSLLDFWKYFTWSFLHPHSSCRLHCSWKSGWHKQYSTEFNLMAYTHSFLATMMFK